MSTYTCYILGSGDLAIKLAHAFEPIHSVGSSNGPIWGTGWETDQL
jgi:hypothetical protein